MKPHTRILVVHAAVATAVLAVLLNRVMNQGVDAVHLAMALVFEAIVVGYGVRGLVRWIIERRRPDDDFPGCQGDYGLAG